MHRSTLVALVATIALGMLPTAAAPARPSTALTTPQCVVTQATFHHYARRVYKRVKITRIAIRKLDRQRACAASAKAAHNMLRFQHRMSAARKERLALDAVTPYRGPGGTRWAVPWHIVACESATSGLWTAANPSGAIGPYQLLGHGAPWPADTRAKRLAHHRIAHALWAGGSGAGNWVCK